MFEAVICIIGAYIIIAEGVRRYREFRESRQYRRKRVQR